MYKYILIIQLICCLILLVLGLFAVPDIIFTSAVAMGTVWGVWVIWELYREFLPVTKSDSDKKALGDLDESISSLSNNSEIETKRKDSNGD